MNGLLNILLAILTLVLAWLAPKPCQAGGYDQATNMKIYRKYQRAYAPRLYIHGRWIYPKGIADAIDANLVEMHRCDVRHDITQETSTGLNDTRFDITIDKKGIVVLVDPRAITVPGSEAETAIECIEAVISKISFPPSFGRRTHVSFLYHGFIESVQDPTPLLPLPAPHATHK